MATSPHTSATFSDFLVSALTRWTDRIAFDDAGREYTYAETAETVSRLVAVLDGHGGLRGTGVGVLSANSVPAWMVVAATKIGGGYVVSLSAAGAADDLAELVRDARLSILVVHKDLAALGAQVHELCPELKAVLSIGPSELGPDILRLAARQPARRLVAAEADPDDVTQIFYTGGTTGRSKGAVHTQRTWLAQVLSLPFGFQLPHEARYLAAGPISHSGYPWIAPVLYGGGTVLLNPSFQPDLFLHTIEHKRATFTMVVPTMVYGLLDALREKDYDVSSLARVMYGASPMSPTRLEEAHERFGRIFAQVYGVVEALGNGTVLPAGLHDGGRPERLLSCGFPAPSVSATLLDEEGAAVPNGTPGELCIRTPSLMREYWNQPEETAEVFAHGWMHTGDIAVRDDEGLYTLVDRKKDVVVSGGVNVFTPQIEHILASDPSVSRVAVIGVPDDKWGEAVKAVVVPTPGHQVDPERLKALVREQKGGVYTPKSFDIVDALPTTAAGKISKKDLRAPYWKGRTRSVN